LTFYLLHPQFIFDIMDTSKFIKINKEYGILAIKFGNFHKVKPEASTLPSGEPNTQFPQRRWKRQKPPSIKEPDDDEKPIETDADTAEEDEISAEGVYPYDPTFADIDIKEDQFSVFEFMRKYERKSLIIDPEFQRKLVWKQEQQSKFIESVIMNFPLPPFYLNQRKDGKLLIIDGLQRTTSIYRYLHDEFELKGLEALQQLNGKKFSDIDAQLRAKIEDKKLLTYTLKPSVAPRVIYDLFNRINTGGTPLNRQEVRNCIFLGKSTQLLKELSEEEYFRRAIDYGIKDTRMKDREAILRFLAFTIFDYESDYEGDMSPFLEKAMVEINRMDDPHLDELKIKFKRVMELTYRFFGSANFRYPTGHSKGLINIAMFESISYFFHNQTDDYLMKNKEKIIENFKILLNDNDYRDSVKQATGAPSRVSKRFKRVFEILGAI
jgi:hypothetical protein